MPSKGERPRILEHIRNGMRPGAAAEFIGLTRHDIFDAIDTDGVFAAEVAEAEREATEHVEEALYQAAVSGNVTACRMWLDLRKPKKVAMVPAAGAPVEADFDQELAELNNLARGD